MGYDEVKAAWREQLDLASGQTGTLRLIHLNAAAALENRLHKMTPPAPKGGGEGGTPMAMAA